MSQVPDSVFASAAELFAVLSAPVRLKIICALQEGELNVSELLDVIDTTQPNMSQHLGTLYRAGVLAKRRDNTQVYYRLHSERVSMLCRAVCFQLQEELTPGSRLRVEDRLMPALARSI
jgi:DNA-binding transcriptional ArsR family regulator